MQYFVRPGDEMKWFEHWKAQRKKWHDALGLGDDNYRFHDHDQLAHYANAATDIEFKFPFGFKELEGIHSRTDFDLKAHEEHSGKKLQFYDPEMEKSFVPYVIETSIGLDRMFLAVISAALKEEQIDEKNTRKVAVLPLLKKDGLPEIAQQIIDELQWETQVTYDDKDAVGRRYRRQDAVGTPYCVTVDHQTLEDETVTLRERDSMQQSRVAIDDLPTIISEKVSMTKALKKLT